MKIFKADEIELKYRVEGQEGPVILLLHGFGGGVHDWSAFADAFSKNYRVVIPSLKSFFSNENPIRFTQQVIFLRRFIEELLIRKKTDSLVIMGQSYGATLSLAMRLNSSYNVKGHVLFNPMPFHPLDHIRNRYLKILISLSYLPGAFDRFMALPLGYTSLVEITKIFRIGAIDQQEISHINKRKLSLVEKALERFMWIEKNEVWSKWTYQLKDLEPGFVDLYYHSKDDSLYTSDDYKDFAMKVKAKEVIPCDHAGHLMIQDLGKNILPSLTSFVNTVTR